MTANLRTPWIFAAIIGVLGLADGLLHLALDEILFHGRFWGSQSFEGPPPGPPGGGAVPAGPPPGPMPPQLPLPLNELFVLNFAGYVVLVILFLASQRWLTEWRWLLDIALIVYTSASIAGWLYVGRPNPQNLGYISKILEIALIATLALDLRALLMQRVTARAAA